MGPPAVLSTGRSFLGLRALAIEGFRARSRYITSTCVLSNSGLSNATSKRPKLAFFRGKYVHHNRKAAKIRFCTSLKLISISGFVDTRDTVNAD